MPKRRADATGYLGLFQNFLPSTHTGVPSELSAPERLAATAPVVPTAPRPPVSTLSGTRGRGTVKRVPVRRAWVQGGRARSHKRPADRCLQEVWCPQDGAVVLDRHDLVQEHVEVPRGDAHQMSHRRLAHQQRQPHVGPRQVEPLPQTHVWLQREGRRREGGCTLNVARLNMKFTSWCDSKRPA